MQGSTSDIISNSSSSSSKNDHNDKDVEEEVHSYLEEFYNNNYFSYQVKTFKDSIHKKVWKIVFDETYDFLYVFIAEFKQITPGIISKDPDLDIAMS